MGNRNSSCFNLLIHATVTGPLDEMVIVTAVQRVELVYIIALFL
jgi:hypothetical protein